MTSLQNFLMGLELRKIRHMLALAEHGSFSRAAEAAHITQPALSRSIQSLEDALGAKLFDRSSRQICLTPVGHLTIEAARQIVESATAFYTLAVNADVDETGELRIGLGTVTASVFGKPLIRGFADRHPSLRLMMQVDTPERSYEMLLAGDLDIVIANTEAAPDQHDMEIDTVATFTRGFFASADHPLARMRDVTPDALLAYQMGSTFPLPESVLQTVKQTYGFSSVGATMKIRSNHYDALVDLMLGSNAIVFGANIAYMAQVRRGELVQLDVNPRFPIEMPLTIASRRARKISSAAPLVGTIVREAIGLH